jgi:hypothetical protein
MLLSFGLPADAAGLAVDQAEANSSQIVGYAKTMLIYDDKKGGRLDQNTAGFGGKLGIRSACLGGVQLEAAYYLTHDLGLNAADPRKIDAYMFDVDKRPYAQLGEMQLSYHSDRLRLSLGRQELHNPLAESYEYRIIPNLFEAYGLDYQISSQWGLSLYYVDKMAGLDALTSYKDFLSMSQQAYPSLMLNAQGEVDTGADLLDLSQVVGKQPLWLLGMVSEEPLRLSLWNAYAPEMLNSLYLEGRYQHELGADRALIYEAQAYQVRDLGALEQFLQAKGLNANYSLWGLKFSWKNMLNGITPSLAYNQFGGNAASMTLYGNWGGYPEFVSMPFMSSEQDLASPLPGARLGKLGLTLDLSAYGWSGQKLILGNSWVDVDDDLLANSDIRVQSLIYTHGFGDNWLARLTIEHRQSANERYDNDYITLSLRYDL